MTTPETFLALPNAKEHIRQVEAEFEYYYGTLDPYILPLLEQLDGMVQAAGDASPYELKTRLYELLCSRAPIRLFRESDFYFEFCAGRDRFAWGGLFSPVGGYLHSGQRDWWRQEYFDALAEDREQGFCTGWSPVGLDHHCPGYDKLLALGLEGIIRQAEAQLADCTDPHKQAFYRCTVRANRALMGLAERFSALAAQLAELAADDAARAHYQKIADTAARVPARPPQTFYEGLCAILFYRECVGTVEGIGFSTFGHLDRMLYPLYQADLAAGRITPEEALRLLCDLLVYTEARFDTRRRFRETSTTIILGGCDRDGNIVFNDLTALVLDAVMNVRSINTKINCRISQNHPAAFLEKIAAVQLADLPTLMMYNDDVLIPCRVAQGQAAEDARLYVGGGCHEIVLQGTEVCTRADTWINLPRILLATMQHAAECTDFEAFYSAFIRDLRAYHDRIAALKNKGEAHWPTDPLILYSGTLAGCIEQGKDLTEGGARYSTTSLSMPGIANLVDSLYAVRQLVFEEKRLTLADFNRILDADFAGEELLQQYIIQKLPKYGTNDAVLNAFAGKVLLDISTVSGQTNARGGKYLPAIYPHNINTGLGLITGATPDGRSAGAPLARGVSPSEFIPTDSPLDVIHSLEHIDFTRFAESCVAEITLPRMENAGQGKAVLLAIMQAFLAAGGSSLQFNLIDRATLLAAKAAPEQHRSLSVRVCGFSALFIYLDEVTQDEVISRAIR